MSLCHCDGHLKFRKFYRIHALSHFDCLALWCKPWVVDYVSLWVLDKLSMVTVVMSGALMSEAVGTVGLRTAACFKL